MLKRKIQLENIRKNRITIKGKDQKKLLQVYMTIFFLFARSILSDMLISTCKDFFLKLFRRVLAVQKHEIALSVWFKTVQGGGLGVVVQ